MTPDHTFLLGVALAGFGFLILGYWLHNSYRGSLLVMGDLLAGERKARQEVADQNYRNAVELERTQRELEWSRVVLATYAMPDEKPLTLAEYRERKAIRRGSAGGRA